MYELERRRRALVASGGALDTEGLEEGVQNLFRYKEEGTVEVHKWITELPYDALQDMTKVCKENQLEEEELLQWTKKVIRKIWIKALDDEEERNVYIKSVMWRITVFLRHLVGETEGRGEQHG